MRAAGLAWYKYPRLFEEVPTISNATFVAHTAHILRSSLALVFALAHLTLLISVFKLTALLRARLSRQLLETPYGLSWTFWSCDDSVQS
jgi:hypothetical protein